MIITYFSATLVLIGSEMFGGNLVNNVKHYTLNAGKITLSRTGRVTNFNWGLAGTFVVDRYLYVAGGAKLMAGSTRAVNNAASKYDVKTDTWTSLPNMNFQHPAGPALFVFNNRLYVVGGNPSIMQMESISLVNPDRWMVETVVPPYKLEMATAVQLLHGSTNYVYIPGSAAAKATTANMLQWNPVYPQWWTTTKMHVQRGLQHCSVTDGTNSIWVIGGCPSRTCSGSFVEKFSSLTATWTSINVKPGALVTNDYETESCSYWNGYIFVTFVTTSTSRLHVFDTKALTWKAINTVTFPPSTYRMSGVVPMANL